MQLQLLTAVVKLFLKKPTNTQELVQQALSLATQVAQLYIYIFIYLYISLSIYIYFLLYILFHRVVFLFIYVSPSTHHTAQESDNPDLRDRGYIYWRLLSTDPAVAKEVVLTDKPLISEETDLLEPTLLG